MLLAVAGLAIYVVERFDGPGPLAADTVVYIPPGTSMGDIARQLERDGVIEDSLVFRTGVRVMRVSRDLKAGEYLFPATVSMRGVVEILLGGKTLMRRLTVPEGATSAEIVKLIEEAPALVGTIKEIPAEGTLLPETYNYERGDTRTSLIVRMQAAMRATLDELWPQRDPDLVLKTPEEAVILASIVEKETGVAEERPLVASVFLNRLKAGMRLQSDPTVAYGMTGGDHPLGRPLTRDDLKTPSPYNTYIIDGLPPGPIANPGRAAIEAVLNPAQTDYLYFVADGSGGHAFAKTLDEHNTNVARWRKLRQGKKP
ncbi:MAG: endolytic transglycosylase MltG [Alphaproteobacteria bacterium]|nr:MAG: endolytic transglycosylase MltG [Alphaproteobacteria bacterium]